MLRYSRRATCIFPVRDFSLAQFFCFVLSLTVLMVCFTAKRVRVRHRVLCFHDEKTVTFASSACDRLGHYCNYCYYFVCFILRQIGKSKT